MTYDSFIQVLLFRDKLNSYRVGPALWAVFAEVAALYNFDQKRANFRRCFLAEWVPPNIVQELKIDQTKVNETLSSREWWNSVRTSSLKVPERLFSEEEHTGLLQTLGPMEDVLYERVNEESQQTVDQALLVKEVRKLLGDVPVSAPLLLVTDQALTPPPSWHYIIWDEVNEERSFVVSTKPTDPRYWGMRTRSIYPIIKRRVRVACCSAAGEMLGFRRCSNPECFLYSSIGSVRDLDEIHHFGSEHEVPKLTGLGYSPEQDEEAPFDVSPLVHV